MFLRIRIHAFVVVSWTPMCFFTSGSVWFFPFTALVSDRPKLLCPFHTKLKNPSVHLRICINTCTLVSASFPSEFSDAWPRSDCSMLYITRIFLDYQPQIYFFLLRVAKSHCFFATITPVTSEIGSLYVDCVHPVPEIPHPSTTTVVGRVTSALAASEAQMVLSSRNLYAGPLLLFLGPRDVTIPQGWAQAREWCRPTRPPHPVGITLDEGVNWSLGWGRPSMEVPSLFTFLMTLRDGKALGEEHILPVMV